jgi:hypothetical protein
VHITAAALGYALAYTFDARPYLLPVWRIAGQIDIGDRHRIAPFVYLSPATR